VVTGTIVPTTAGLRIGTTTTTRTTATTTSASGSAILSSARACWFKDHLGGQRLSISLSCSRRGTKRSDKPGLVGVLLEEQGFKIFVDT